MILQYILSTTTALLSNEENSASFPYARKSLDCFDTTNELDVDQTNNQVCLNLKHNSNSKCSAFKEGVFYDLHFDNSPSWRTKQSDYTISTEKFCFPCYNNDCLFLKESKMVKAQIKNFIYQSDIAIGSIVQKRTNTSNCFDPVFNKLIRGDSGI